MPEQYIKAEIIKPHMDAEAWFAQILESIFTLGIRTLFVWWAIAAWFPELGITYWQALLPVYAIHSLFTSPVPWRVLKK